MTADCQQDPAVDRIVMISGFMIAVFLIAIAVTIAGPAGDRVFVGSMDGFVLGTVFAVAVFKISRGRL